jgi:hypothetical protein
MKQAALPVLVLLVVVTLAVVAALPSASVEADHYHRFRDGKSLYTLLSSSIGRGYSLQDVEELIGPGIPITEEVAKYREDLRETAQWQPDSYPDGIQDADVFLTWSASEQKVTLQFRNGFLVNHDPVDFAEYQPVFDVAGQTGRENEDTAEPFLTIAGRGNASRQVIRERKTPD